MNKKVILLPISFTYYSEYLVGIKRIIQFKLDMIKINMSFQDMKIINNIFVY